MEQVVVDKYEVLSDTNVIVQVGSQKPKMMKIFHENVDGILCNDLKTYIDYSTATRFEFE